MSTALAQIQRKLAVGGVDDPLEHQADRAAERVVRMPDLAIVGNSWTMRRACKGCEQHDELTASGTGSTGGSALQRLVADEQIEEELRGAFLREGDVLQRRVVHHDDGSEGETVLMQMMPSGGRVSRGPATLESRVSGLEGRGAALSRSMREYMEPRFGRDLADVRVHTDTDAAETAQMVNARAFTLGRNIVFASGEYAPDTTAHGRLLLAHELAHVIQQDGSGRRIQRRIVVAGAPYTPTPSYYVYLNRKFGPAMKEFVERMHNGGNPPDRVFTSYEQLGTEVRVRAQAIKGIEVVHQGCCDYYSTADPPHLDSTYWHHIGSSVDFKVKSPLPSGKQASDAVRAIFAPGAKTRLECFSMTAAIEYFSLLNGLGEARFNILFPGGAGIEISQNASIPSQVPLLSGGARKYNVIAVASKSDLLSGDWVYFKNFRDYTVRVPGGAWQGENAIYLGGGRFRGFGVASLTESQLNRELVDRYNNDGTPRLTKTVADLIADGGGLLLSPVIRPEISKLVP